MAAREKYDPFAGTGSVNHRDRDVGAVVRPTRYLDFAVGGLAGRGDGGTNGHARLTNHRTRRTDRQRAHTDDGYRDKSHTHLAAKGISALLLTQCDIRIDARGSRPTPQ